MLCLPFFTLYFVGFLYLVVEWVGPKNGERTDKVVFDKERKKIHVNDLRRKPLRMLDFRRIEGTVQKVHFRISTDHENNMLSVRLPGEIDLVSLSISFEFAVPYYQLQLIFFLLNLFIKMSLNFHNSGRCIALVVVY